MRSHADSRLPVDPGPGETTVLVHRLHGGDPEAKDRLYERLRDPVLARIRSHNLFDSVRHRVSEDEVLSDVLDRCEATQAFENFEHQGPRSLHRFLGTVVHCAMVDIVRRDMAKKRGGGWRRLRIGTRNDEEARDDGPASPEPSPTSQARVDELVHRVKRVLSDREWEVWSQSVLDDLSAEDIAAREGATKKAIWSLLQRARSKLVAAIAEDYPEWVTPT